MKQFRSNYPIDFPLLSGLMIQMPSKFLVSLIPKLRLSPSWGFIKRICQVSSLVSICSSKNQAQTPSTDDTNRAGIEVNELNIVMTRLGLHCQGEGPLDNITMDEIEGMFEEDEPSFGEIKQAFDVFDRNGDGFIDALELHGVLSSLGVMKGGSVTQNVEVCGRILGGFDHKGVGLVDIHDFVRLMETCLASHH